MGYMSTKALNQCRTIQERYGGGIPQRLKEALSDANFKESFTRGWEVYTSFASTCDSWDDIFSVDVCYWARGIKVIQIIDHEGNVGLCPVQLNWGAV